MNWLFPQLVVIALGLLVAQFAPAAELTADPIDAPATNLVQVVVPQSDCAAVDPAGSWLAFSHRPPAAAKQAGEIWLYGLDKDGGVIAGAIPAPPPAPPAPAGKPAAKIVAKPPAAPIAAPPPLHTVVVPRPASLAAYPSTVQCLLFHPKLPLLYVWQDIAGPAPKRINGGPVFDDFEHLLIYQLVSGQAPRLVVATARGPEFMYGLSGGVMVLDGPAKRIFLPNLQLVGEKVVQGAVGYVKLGEDGMPVKAGDRLGMVMEALPAHSEVSVAHGYVPVSDGITVFGGRHGPTTWDAGNRRGKFNSFFLTGLPAGRNYLIGHPSLPQVYVSGVGVDSVWRMEHADGYLTMQPQQLAITGAVLHSPPVFASRRNELVLGGTSKVYMAKLDENGMLTPRVTQVAVDTAAVEAVVYSQKYDRIYVAVDKAP